MSLPTRFHSVGLLIPFPGIIKKGLYMTTRCQTASSASHFQTTAIVNILSYQISSYEKKNTL